MEICGVLKRVLGGAGESYLGLSKVVVVSSIVVVSDYKGFLHVIAQTDGRFVARKRLDNKGMRAPILADGNRMYALGNSGRLFALEVL